jgi:ketosteroid isomerase-like protein
MPMPADTAPFAVAAEDRARLRNWFESLAQCVQAVDFAGAYPLFADELVAFGTVKDFVRVRPEVEREQWRQVWPTIRNFRWRLDDMHAIVSADRLTGIGMAIFDSDGFDSDGKRYARRGRATVAFSRPSTDAPWVAIHTHMSLVPGTPPRSHGRFSDRGDQQPG